MKKAIVFAGGGSKGAYQMGAWKALNELGEDFQIAVGTSIGSINAAYYCMKRFEDANAMWRALTAEDVMTNGINFEKSFETIFSQRENLIPFIKNYINSKGADVTPFHTLLSQMFDEKRFFGSDIDYALMTVRFPSMEPYLVTKKMMADAEEPWKWIAASAACFPVFPVMKIGEEQFADGGYYDNVPVAAAFSLGAEQVTVIDLKPDQHHEGYFHHPFVKYIYPTKDLGTFMNFEKEALDFSIQMGYDDTMKAYGRAMGQDYTFLPDLSSPERYNAYGELFIRLLTEKECCFDYSGKVGKLGLQRVNKLEGCTTLLSQMIKKQHPSPTQYFIKALELYLTVRGEKSDITYKLDELLYRLKLEVDRLYPLLEYDPKTAFETLEKHFYTVGAQKSDIKKWDDERHLLILTALARTLQQLNI